MPADALYLRVADDLRRRILEGDLPPGSAFPSRRQLRKYYGMGDGPVAKATALLRADGLVAGHQRYRLVVTHPVAVRTMTDPTAPWPHGIGDRWRSEVAATPDQAARLAVPPGTTLSVETTEHLDLDSRPSHLRIVLTPPEDRGPAVTHRGETWMRGAVAGEAGVLGVTIGSGLLIVSLVLFAADGRPVVAEDLVLPGDRWRVRNS